MKKRLFSVILALLIAMSVIPTFAVGETDVLSQDITVAAENGTAQTAGSSSKQMEALNRGGFAAANPSGGMYLSWRLLGSEPTTTVFNIYKNGSLYVQSLANTNYTDASGTESDVYAVSAVIDGVEGKISDEFTPFTGTYTSGYSSAPYAYFDIPIVTPEEGSDYTYSANDASVGDVDGDGEYEIILKWDPSNSKDSASSGVTGNVYIDCYEFDGTLLWRIDLGANIRAGAHYTQFQVFDYDGDSKAEVAMKTAPGSIDGKGNYVTAVGNTSTILSADNSETYVGSNGHITGGPEYLTIFNGETGAAMQTIDWDAPLGASSDWGDSSYNRSDRYLAGTAYLDGVHPSMIFARGYYSRAVVFAYNWDGENLSRVWKIDSSETGNSDLAGQGHHQISVADLDNDGCDEIVYGGAALDNDGTILWSVYNNGKKLGHGDALHVSDFDNDGEQEIFKVSEDSPNWGKALIAADGTLEWISTSTGDDGRGVMANFSAKYGALAWDSALDVRTMDNTVVSSVVVVDNKQSYPNFSIFWDGDLLSEHFDKLRIQKWSDYDTADSDGNLGSFGRLTQFSGVEMNNSTKNNPALQADIFGDWREELIFRTSDGSALRVFASIIPTEHMLTTFMHDGQYRCAIAWQNTAYNQPPHTSYYIGEDKTEYEQPDISVVELNPEIKLTVTADGVPASGVSVELGGIEKPTNSDGEVIFRVEAGTYTYTVDQVGYNIASGEITLASGDESVESAVELETLPESTITVVCGETPVSGATVTFDDQALETDENGVITVKLREGDNDYTVECHKYETATGTITVPAEGITTQIEIEAVEYVYDSTLDEDGSQFVYSGGDGATLTFSNGSWSFVQDSTDGGRSFGADFEDISEYGNVTFELTYKTGGVKDSSSEWSWTDRPYKHYIELRDESGNVVVGISQEYTASGGAQQAKYYTGTVSTTNVNSGNMIGSPNITARSSSTWRIVFDIDLNSQTADITFTDEAGENGYVISDVAISTTSFASIEIGSSASGNVTWSPTLYDVLYWSDCVSDGTSTPRPTATAQPTTEPTVYKSTLWDFGDEPFTVTEEDGTVHPDTNYFPQNSSNSERYDITSTSVTDSSHFNGLTYTTASTSNGGYQASTKTFEDGFVSSWQMKSNGAGTATDKVFAFVPAYDGTVKVYARSGSGSNAATLTISQGALSAKHEYPATESGDVSDVDANEDGTFPVVSFDVTAGTEVKIYSSSNTGYYAIAYAVEGEAEPTTEPSATPDDEPKDTQAYTINGMSDESGVISVSVTKNAETSEKAMLIVAAYDDEGMVLTGIDTVELDMSLETKDIEAAVTASGGKVRAFIWIADGTIIPLSDVFEK